MTLTIWQLSPVRADQQMWTAAGRIGHHGTAGRAAPGGVVVWGVVPARGLLSASPAACALPSGMVGGKRGTLGEEPEPGLEVYPPAAPSHSWLHKLFCVF